MYIYGMTLLPLNPLSKLLEKLALPLNESYAAVIMVISS